MSIQLLSCAGLPCTDRIDSHGTPLVRSSRRDESPKLAIMHSRAPKVATIPCKYVPVPLMFQKNVLSDKSTSALLHQEEAVSIRLGHGMGHEKSRREGANEQPEVEPPIGRNGPPVAQPILVHCPRPQYAVGLWKEESKSESCMLYCSKS